MAALETKDIRNIALVGHGGAGKTILAEAILHHLGVTKRIGSLKDGTTVCDFNPDEKEKNHSLDASTVFFTHNNVHFNLIDTPGYPDFLGNAIGALAAVETAVVVVNAMAGIEVNTRRMWHEATREGLARMVLITRMDGENVDAQKVLADIREQFGEECLPMNLPIGQGASFTGVEDVLMLSDSPSDVIGSLEEAHNQLADAVVEVDDDLMEKYLENGEVSRDEMIRVTAKAIASGHLVPVLFCAAEKAIGVVELLNLIANDGPTPLTGKKRRLIQGEESSELDPSGSPLYAQVFKMVTDPFVGKLSYFRVHSGTLTADHPFINQRTGHHHKINGLYRLQGKEQLPVSSAVAGDIVAVPKLDDVQITDTFSDTEEAGRVEPIPFPRPMVSLAVEPKSRKDEQKITSALAKIADEDATFSINRDAEIHQLVVSGLSDLHLETMLHRLLVRFEVAVTTSIPHVPYKETLSKTGQAHYRHKKQTGGRGQFGEVWLKVEPLERGAGFEFVNEVVGGSIPGQYLPAVEKGVREAMTRGVFAGYELIDARVRVYDGKFHPVDSSEAAFRMAGSKAFREAILCANPVLLEPIVNVEISIPNQFMGDITGDLNSRRGRVMGMDTDGSNPLIKAQVPLAEVMSYSAQLRSMTGGEGSFTMDYSHLDIVPSKIADHIKSQFKGHAEEE